MSALAEVAPASTDPTIATYDIIVIGSGIGGLTAAALQARAGQRVLLLEQGAAVGGYAHAFTRGDYIFDPAVHLIGDPGLFDGLLGYLGVRERCGIIPLDSFYKVMLPGFALTAPFGREAFIATHERAFPHEAAGIRAFFTLCAQIHHDAHDLPPQVPLRELDAVIARYPTLFKYRRSTLQEVLDEFIADRRAQAVCAATWIYLGLPPSRVSFQTFAQLVFSHIDGAFAFSGGIQQLIDALIASFERDGGQLLTRTRVERILTEGGTACGVRLADGRELRADCVISNADPRQTYEDLIGAEHLPPAFLRNFRRLKPSSSAFLVFAATTLDLHAMDPAAQTFIFSHWDHDENYRQVQQGHPAALMINPTSLHDPSLAPAGEQIVIGTMLAPYDLGTPWHEVKNACVEEILGQIEVAYPGFRQQLTFAESASPLTLERFSLNYRGAIHSWEQSPDQIESKRPTMVTPIDNLYLASQWTSVGGSFLRALLAGVAAAKLVRRDVGLPDDLPDFRSLPQL